MRVLRDAGRVQDERGARGSGQLQELLQGVLLHCFHKELIILQGKATSHSQGKSKGAARTSPLSTQRKPAHGTGAISCVENDKVT